MVIKMTKYSLLQRTGFTLAEVLITLGIIGVVAALTIPSLTANTGKRQYSVKFKKAISTLSNAARMSSELYGYDFAGITAPCSNNAGTDNPESRQSICALLNGTLKGATYHKGIKELTNYNLKSSSFNGMDSVVNYQNSIPVYSFPDGTLLLISAYLSNNPKPCTMTIGKSVTITYDGFGNGCYGYIDVNGTSLPNKEVTCSKGSNKTHVRNAGNCIVNAKDINDIFPVQFYDGTAEPMSSAGWYVLQNAK